MNTRLPVEQVLGFLRRVPSEYLLSPHRCGGKLASALVLYIRLAISPIPVLFLARC